MEQASWHHKSSINLFSITTHKNSLQDPIVKTQNNDIL